MQDRQWDGEQSIVCHDRATAMRAVIAVDDTRCGPGLGGVRFARYPDVESARQEAQRLASAMTRKLAAAELPYGGAKSVIMDTGVSGGRAELMRAFGRHVARLGGAYIPGVDMGTTVEDLTVIGEVAPDVACDRDDPSPWTALGVWAGICAAVGGATGRRLDGVRVLVQGAGHVGSALALLLSESGASVLVSDLDHDRAHELAVQVDGHSVDPADVLDTSCDVFAPCAGAKVIDAAAVHRLRCRWVAGAANDTLAARHVADLLHRHEVVFVPDFLLNAGGVIQIHGLRAGWSQERLTTEVERIGLRVADVLERAGHLGQPPLAVAEAAIEARAPSVA